MSLLANFSRGTKELEFYAIAPRGYKAMLGLVVGRILTPIITIKKLKLSHYR
jgi:hypothetical protein